MPVSSYNSADEQIQFEAVPTIAHDAQCKEALELFRQGSELIVVTEHGKPRCVLRPSDVLLSAESNDKFLSLPSASVCSNDFLLVNENDSEKCIQQIMSNSSARYIIVTSDDGKTRGAFRRPQTLPFTDLPTLLLADICTILSLPHTTLSDEEPLLSAMKALTESQKNLVLVVSRQSPPAVIDRSDMTALAAKADDPWTTPLAEFRLPEALVLPIETDVHDALHELQQHPQMHVLAMDENNNPAGLFNKEQLEHALRLREARSMRSLLDSQRTLLTQEIRAHAQRLAHLESFLATQLRTGIIGISLERRIIFCSRPARDLLHAFSTIDPVGKELHILALSIDFFRSVQNALGQCNANAPCTFTQPIPDSETTYISCTLTDLAEGNKALGYALTLRETAHKTAEGSLEQQAFYDALTKLPNRHLFAERVAQEMRRSQREGNRFALLFMDLDHFKYINDNYGHMTGDELLYEAAQRLHDAIRKSDTVARFGGDEFLALLPSTAPGEATEQVVAKIRAALSRPFELERQTFTISCSIGTAHFPDDGTTVGELMEIADRNMYKDKIKNRLGR